jgi:hypothetical protein
MDQLIDIEPVWLQKVLSKGMTLIMKTLLVLWLELILLDLCFLLLMMELEIT